MTAAVFPYFFGIPFGYDINIIISMGMYITCPCFIQYMSYVFLLDGLPYKGLPYKGLPAAAVIDKASVIA